MRYCTFHATCSGVPAHFDGTLPPEKPRRVPLDNLIAAGKSASLAKHGGPITPLLPVPLARPYGHFGQIVTLPLVNY